MTRIDLSKACPFCGHGESVQGNRVNIVENKSLGRLETREPRRFVMRLVIHNQAAVW